MQVGDIMHADVKTVSADDTFVKAASVLHDNRISSIIVKADGAPAGIVTERDFVTLIAEGGDASSTTIGDRMTRDLATVEPRTDVADAARIMAERGIRHLPVVDRGELVGIISIRDLMSWAFEEMTGGHELADMERGSATLAAAMKLREVPETPER